MSLSDYKPSGAAGAMQDKTRAKHNFDKVEASLPNPAASTMTSSTATSGFPFAQLSQLTPTNILTRLGNLNPFGRPVNDDDVVWLLDNTAYRPSGNAPWQAEFVAAVFERDAKCEVIDMVKGVATTLGLADDAEERKTIEKRLMPFLWDVKVARILRVLHQDRDLKLKPTNVNGITAGPMRVPHSDGGSIVKARADVASGVNGILDMKTVYAGEDGWGIISDIDDTIKVTMTSDPVGILRSTFVDEPKPVPGMPELYSQVQSLLPEDTPWFYLSASPYNLYPFLKGFRDDFYPQGTFILRDMSWKTIAGLLSALTMGTEDYKVDRMKKINSWLPKRKMIVVGDSTQSDPEAYGEIYRSIPGWIKMILIRKATDVAALGIDEKNEPERFEKAFKDVPKDAWHVFEDPAECVQLIKDVIEKE